MNQSRTYLKMTLVLVPSILMLSLISGLSVAEPASVDADIQVNGTWDIAPNEGEKTVVEIDGSFILTERTGLDRLTPVTATLSVSQGQWDAVPRQTVYNGVTTEDWETFTIDVTIPEDAKVGQTSSYTISILFEAQTSEVTETAGFVVTLIGANGDDDSDPGDENENREEQDGSDARGFPLWPVFVLGLIVLLVFAGLWAYRNIEIVRETDGKRRIYLREKDTGRIIGRDR